MKKVVLSVLTLIVLGIAMNAQANVKEEAPNAVVLAFNKLFPKATDLVWEKDDLEHIIYFSEDEVAKYCRLDAQGKWLEKGVAITSALPKSVMDIILLRYDEVDVSEKYTVTLFNKKKATLVIFESGGELTEILIAENSDILRERALTTQEDWEEDEPVEDDGDWR